MPITCATSPFGSRTRLFIGNRACSIVSSMIRATSYFVQALGGEAIFKSSSGCGALETLKLDNPVAAFERINISPFRSVAFVQEVTFMLKKTLIAMAVAGALG